MNLKEFFNREINMDLEIKSPHVEVGIEYGSLGGSSDTAYILNRCQLITCDMFVLEELRDVLNDIFKMYYGNSKSALESSSGPQADRKEI